MIETLFKTLGPWGIALGVMAYLLKIMVADKLTTIQRTLSQLVEGQSDHAERIVRIETVLRINGCGSPDIACDPPHRRSTDG